MQGCTNAATPGWRGAAKAQPFGFPRVLDQTGEAVNSLHSDIRPLDSCLSCVARLRVSRSWRSFPSFRGSPHRGRIVFSSPLGDHSPTVWAPTPSRVIAKERSDCGNLTSEYSFHIEIATPRNSRFAMTFFRLRDHYVGHRPPCDDNRGFATSALTGDHCVPLDTRICAQ